MGRKWDRVAWYCSDDKGGAAAGELVLVVRLAIEDRLLTVLLI